MGGLRRLPLLARLGLVLALLAGALGAVATVDHHRKQAQRDEASVASWFCEHRNEQCGGDTPERIERRWVQRERWYQAGASALLLAAPIGLLIFGRPRRPRPQDRRGYARRNVSTASTRR